MNRSRINRNRTADRKAKGGGSKSAASKNVNSKRVNPQHDNRSRTDKTHQTAVVIIPPRGVWEPIQEVRRTHDKQFRRWMPHLTLLYPFAPKSEFTRILPDLAEASWAQGPFELTLSEFRSFRHGRESFTVWLAPTPTESLTNLHRTLTEALPQFGDTGSFKDGFTPHLSVGQAQGAGKLERLLAELNESWEPLRFTVNELSLISRKTPPNDIFQIDRQLTLGG